MRENPLAAGAPRRTSLGELAVLTQTIAGGAAPSPRTPPPLSALRASLLASPNPFSKNPLM